MPCSGQMKATARKNGDGRDGWNKKVGFASRNLCFLDFFDTNEGSSGNAEN